MAATPGNTIFECVFGSLSMSMSSERARWHVLLDRFFDVALFIVLTMLMTGCKPDEFGTADELVHFLEAPENNLSYQTEHDDLRITLSYKPTDLMVYSELGDSPADYTQLSNLQKKYEAYYFFILSFSHATKSNEIRGSFFEKVQNLSYNLNEYVNLTTSSDDTIYVGEFAPIRSFSPDKASDIVIVFKKEKSKGQDWLQFNLNEFGLGVGDQQFKFRVKDLEQVPRLKFAIVS